MANLYQNQSSNVLKTWVLMALFLAFIVGLGYFFAETYNAPQIFYFAIILSILMNVVSYWYSDKLVLSLSKARPATREEFFDLYTVTENLSIAAGLPMPKLYVIDDLAPNAFATGRNKEHATVAVTTGLLQILDRSELEGVVAHELSHIGNKDILLMTVVAVLVGSISLLADIFLRSHIFGGGRRSDDRGGNALALIGLILAILSPIVATIIKLAISRKREFLADASGALLTRYPEGLASALKKIASYGHPMRHAHNATAHLFIENPYGADRNGDGVVDEHDRKVGRFARMFMTHPPVEDRIAALTGMR